MSNNLESIWQLCDTCPEQALEAVARLRIRPASGTLDHARLLIIEAACRWRHYQFDDVMRDLPEALKILSGSDDYLWLARLHGRTSVALVSLGDMHASFKYLRLQLAAAKKCVDGPGKRCELFTVFHNLGRYFFVKQDYRRANHYYRRCYRYIQIRDSRYVLLLQNHAETHARLLQLRVAAVEIERALELGAKMGAFRPMLYALGVKSWICNACGQPDAAVQTLVEAKALAIQQQMPSAQIRMKLAALHLQQGKPGMAGAELRPVQQLIDTYGDRHDAALYSELMSQQCEASGNFAAALSHYKQFHASMEAIFSTQRDTRAEAESLVHRMEQIRREASNLREQNRALQHSVSRLKSLHEQARYDSERDPLTALYNRRVLTSLASAILQRAAADNSGVVLGIIDLDKFKTINDRFGHSAGDQVLREFSALIGKCFRADDCVARYGGEEFVVCLPNAKIDNALSALCRLQQQVRKFPWVDINPALEVTFSAGVAENRTTSSYDELFLAADKALYQAKSNGRNQICRATDAQLPGSTLVTGSRAEPAPERIESKPLDPVA